MSQKSSPQSEKSALHCSSPASPNGSSHSSVTSNDMPFSKELLGVVNAEIFQQLIDMDEPDDEAFSEELIFECLQQAHSTIDSIKVNLEQKCFEKLSELGHFLKGATASTGMYKMRDACECVQRYGSHEDMNGDPMTDDEELLRRIAKSVDTIVVEFGKAKKEFARYYDWDEDKLAKIAEGQSE